MKSLKKIILILVLFEYQCAYAQNQKVLDSLNRVYQNAKHDTTKILVLTEIANQFVDNNPDTCVSISLKIIDESKKIEFQKGNAHGQYLLGIAYTRKGNYPLALNFHFQSLKIREGIYDKKATAASLQGIGNVYINQQDYQKALASYKRSLSIKEEIRDSINMLGSLHNIGVVYKNLKDYSLALEYAEKALLLSKKLGVALSTSHALKYIGDIYLVKGDYDNALNYAQQSLIAYDYKKNNEKRGLIFILNSLALIHQKRNEYEKSIEYAKEGIRLAKEIKLLVQVREISKILSETYKLQKDFENALLYHLLFQQTNDSLFNIEKAKSVANLESRFLLEKKEKELALLAKDNELNKLEAEKKERELQITKKQAETEHLFALARAEKDKRKQDSLYNLAQKSELEAKNLKTQEEKNRLEQEKKVLTYEAEVVAQKQIRNTFLVLSSALIFIVVLVALSLRQKQKSNYEIQAKNEALQTTQEELYQNMEELDASHELLIEQKKLIETSFAELHKQNTKVNDSIRYAQRIQNAILPHEDSLMRAFAEHFVIFKPKDVVSGDFYWYLEIENKKFIAVIDCTGHGVPGAFMSMIGNTLLYEIINTKQIFEPHLILDQLHLGVLNALNKKDAQIQDGMDIALCCIEAQETGSAKVLFSGAKRPLYYFSGNTLSEIQADRKSIGQAHAKETYKLHQIELKAGDTLYMTTDGWIDAINPERKRFGSKQFKEMLIKGASLPLKAQEEVFRSILEEYEQGTEQRDDILVVGVKI